MHAYSEEMPTLSPSGSRRTLLPNEQNDNEPNENDENASESANVGNNSNNVHAGVDGECCYGLFDCSNLLDVSVESDGEAATRHRHDRGSNGHHSHSHDHQTPEDQDECCFGVVQCSDPKS